MNKKISALTLSAAFLPFTSLPIYGQPVPSCLTVKPGYNWICRNGGWLPPDNPISGITHGAKLEGSDRVIWVFENGKWEWVDCKQVNPYSTVDNYAALCATAYPETGTNPVDRFEVGRDYKSPYGDVKIRVIGVNEDLTGKRVVTAQYTSGVLIGTYKVFVESEANVPWTLIK